MHLLAATPFTTSGEIELVNVITPHIGGIVEYLTLLEDKLQVTTTLPGYSTHTIGSRNLDMALAGDFDGNGIAELLVPNQDMNALAIIQKTEIGVQPIAVLSLGSRISTNIAAVDLGPDGSGVGVGLENSSLRIWLSGFP